MALANRPNPMPLLSRLILSFDGFTALSGSESNLFRTACSSVILLSQEMFQRPFSFLSQHTEAYLLSFCASIGKIPVVGGSIA
jgi:hypothetical protein